MHLVRGQRRRGRRVAGLLRVPAGLLGVPALLGVAALLRVATLLGVPALLRVTALLGVPTRLLRAARPTLAVRVLRSGHARTVEACARPVDLKSQSVSYPWCNTADGTL
nr:hypothetical protein GCM10017745_11040 [Saccharothrix mutabilis subsp. capreolus]